MERQEAIEQQSEGVVVQICRTSCFPGTLDYTKRITIHVECRKYPRVDGFRTYRSLGCRIKNLNNQLAEIEDRVRAARRKHGILKMKRDILHPISSSCRKVI